MVRPIEVIYLSLIYIRICLTYMQFCFQILSLWDRFQDNYRFLPKEYTKQTIWRVNAH